MPTPGSKRIGGAGSSKRISAANMTLSNDQLQTEACPMGSRVMAPPHARGHETASAMAMLFLGGILVFTAWRMTLEGGVWCDELFTIRLIRCAVPRLIATTAVDANPPLYYLLLKAWTAVGRAVGLEPGLLWSRLPGLACWLAMIAAAWKVGRRVLGESGGPLLAMAVGCCAQVLWGVRNLRGYATSAPLTTICFLLMFYLVEAARAGRLSARRATLGWTLYGVAAEIALWSHLLVSFVLLLLGLWWMAEAWGMARRVGSRRAALSPLVIGGALTQALVVVGFAPWLLELGEQVKGLQGPRREWMTPPTAINFLKVFVFWHPWGGMGDNLVNWVALWERPSERVARAILGMLTMALPATAAIARWLRRRRVLDAPGLDRASVLPGYAAGRLAIAGLGVGALNIAILWSLDRLGIQYVFHGPRYTIFSNAIWGAGLAGLAMAASRRLATGMPRWGIALALLAPWLIANVGGTLGETCSEARVGLPTAIRFNRGLFPPDGAPLYIISSEFIPYFPKTFSPWRVRPSAAFAEIPNGANGVRFFCFPQWLDMSNERDLAVYSLLKRQVLGNQATSSVFPKNWTRLNQYEIIQVDGFRASLARAVVASKFRLGSAQ
jgi:hypothetical protein